MAKDRPKIPKDVEDEVLYRSRHTCNICKDSSKHVEIHHIDGNPSNNVIANLIVLCRDCHSKVTAKSLGKSFTKGELEKYRSEWEALVRLTPLPQREEGHDERPEVMEKLDAIMQYVSKGNRALEHINARSSEKRIESMTAKDLKQETKSSRRKDKLNIVFLRKLAYTLYKKQEYQQALEVYDHIMMMDRSYSGFCLRNKARLYLIMKKSSRSMQIASNLLSTEPKKIENLLLMSSILISRGKYKRALEHCDKVLKQDPRNMTALIMKADILYQLKDFTESLVYHANVLKINPKNIETLHHTGVINCELGKHDEALKYFQRALAVKSNNSNLLYSMGIEHYHLEDTEKALEFYDRALKINPILVNALTNKAILLSQKGDHTQSLSLFLKAHELSPNDHKPLYGIANESYELGKLDDALQYYTEFLKTKLDWQAMHMRAIILSEKGRHEDAIKDLDEALKLKPNSATMLYSKAFALNSLKRYNDAKLVYNMVLEIDPNHVSSLVNKAVIIYQQENKPKEGLELIGKALSLEPDHAIALVNKGNMLSSLGDNEKALDSYERALTIIPNYGYAIINKAGVLMEQGKKEEALDCCKRGLTDEVLRAPMLYLYSKILNLSGNTEEAISALKKSILADESMIEKARDDEAFENLRSDSRFISLLDVG